MIESELLQEPYDDSVLPAWWKWITLDGLDNCEIWIEDPYERYEWYAQWISDDDYSIDIPPEYAPKWKPGLDWTQCKIRRQE